MVPVLRRAGSEASDGIPIVVSRTGYTGELGYEVWCHPDDGAAVWDAVWEAGGVGPPTPFGLDALDMVRIEAGPDRRRATSSTTRSIRSRPASGSRSTCDNDEDFVGRAALDERVRASRSGCSSACELEGNEVAAHGDPVHVGRQQVGVVTSGTRSPVLQANIALCRMAVQHRALGHGGRGRQARRAPEADPGDGRARSRSTTPRRRGRGRKARPHDRRASPTTQVDAFHRDGFLIVDEGLVSATALDQLRERFQRLFDGEYETGIKPDEVNWVDGPRPRGRDAADLQRMAGGHDDRRAGPVRTHGTAGVTADGLSRRAPPAGQLLWKPPGTKAIGFHQDGSYADYLVPPEMVTCWIALDDTQAGAGTLEYVRGSHHWPKVAPVRSQFHAPDDWLEGARAVGAGGNGGRDRAGRREGRRRLVPPQPHVARIASNTSGTVARMALVSHMLAVETRFHPTNVDLIYSRYRRHGDLSMDESFFPVMWDETGGRTSWLAELPDLDD